MTQHTFRLSLLDHSTVRPGGTAAQAIAETIATVKLAERLGYHRFWVAEHHNSAALAGSTPEVLMVKLAAETEHIRVGSGGIMLPNHSALKVAENFRMLETLFPGRIDLGMGRTPGTDRITSELLNPCNDFSQDSYIEQLTHLQAFFRDEAATEEGPVLAIPQSLTTPEQWVLSSSGGSSAIAAQFGMGLAIAKFINGRVSREVVETYRCHFQPSLAFPEPQVLLALYVLCGETEAEARALRQQWDYAMLCAAQGKSSTLGTGQEYPAYSPAELESLQAYGAQIVCGTPAQVRKQLTALAQEFGLNEIMVLTATVSQEQRRRSFELVAKAFELQASVMADSF